jgi:hypothetical protein
MKTASVDDIKQVAGIPKNFAEKLWALLHAPARSASTSVKSPSVQVLEDGTGESISESMAESISESMAENEEITDGETDDEIIGEIDGEIDGEIEVEN